MTKEIKPVYYIMDSMFIHNPINAFCNGSEYTLKKAIKEAKRRGDGSVVVICENGTIQSGPVWTPFMEVKK